MKRIKRVFNSSEQVIHLWANQSQSDAKCKNVFFEGNKIYSYGMHYELGRLHQVNGQTIAVINNSGYSVTTSKHISSAYAGVSHLPRLKSTKPESIETGLLETQDRLMNELFNHFNSRTFYYKINSDDYTLRSIREYNKVCDILNKPKMKLDVDSDFIKLMNEHVKKCLKRKEELNSPEELAKKESKRLAKVAKLKLELADKIQAWKCGGPAFKELKSLNPQIIRINGTEIETSQGASVPFLEAKLLLAKILNNSAKQGDKIGSFRLDSVSGDYCKIGCHVIDLNEAKMLLKQA